MDLTYKRQNVYALADEQELKAISDYAEGYKRFLDNGKTEREAVKETIEMIEKKGYKPYTLGDKINAGDKLYYNNRGKSLFIVRAGKADVAKNGVRILVAHVDSPRLDLKQVPLYEKADMAYFKTHYYGGIKKYQWLTIPLALHGVIALKDGTCVDVKVGDEEGDPVFYITDILPHLAQEQVTKTIAEGFPAENLNLLVGGIPVKDEEKDAVKKGVLEILNQKYGVCEEDFLSAELEAVPASNARDVGFDRAFVASYGHDDRVCAYTSLRAILDAKPGKYTYCCILVDKEEIGSVGATGAHSLFFENSVADLLAKQGYDSYIALKKAFTNTKMLSSDVSAGFDPLFPEVNDTKNAAYLNNGIVFNKYTGARGKSGSNDAMPEFMAEIRNALDKEDIHFQTAELGKVDQGGGGTIAYILGNYNMNVIDAGIAVLNMHAPMEIVAKADVYETYLAYMAFLAIE